MANQSKEKLFQGFPPVSTEAWEKVIEKDLKGADYEKKLVWRSLEGFKVQPYYRSENLKDKTYLDILPGEYPYVRGNKASNNDWEIRQDITVNDVKVANEKVLDILNKGVTSVGFKCCSGNCQCSVLKAEDMKALLNEVVLDCVALNFSCGCEALPVLENLIAEVKSNGVDAKSITGTVSFDAIGKLTATGKWYTSEEEDLATLKTLIEKAEAELPAYKVLKVRGCVVNSAGASVVQELGYALAMAAEYIAKLTDAGLTVDQIAPHIELSFGVGSSYFMEMAKVRAARLLWAKMIEAFNPSNEDSKKVFIHSTTTAYNQTIYDPHVNILRATTEAMSAILGGTDSLSVKPFDASYSEETELSERVARNIQNLLKEESYFDKIVDPSSGSYYIESLTDSIIEEAWKLFLSVEEKGGYLAALKAGEIQADIEATAADRDKKIAQRREILLGTNQFPNFNEKIAANINEAIAFDEGKKSGDVIKPLRKYRGSFAFDQLRLATEKSGKNPKAFMLTIGNLAFRKARATFSCNFFACAGYEVVDNLGFETVEEGIKAALDAGADIIVLCSSDDEYVEFAPVANDAIGDKAILVVAGAPKCMDDLKAKGIENFIHVRSNVFETLQGFNTKLGIS